MVCFCKDTAAKLQEAVQAVEAVSVSADVADESLTDEIKALADELTQAGLPAPAWQPDPAWLDLPLPVPALSASAIATISAIASLRASLLAQLGIDLLVPAQTVAFARLAATLTARLGDLAPLTERLAPVAGDLAEMAENVQAAETVQAALKAGIIAPGAPPPVLPTLPPMDPWQEFLAKLKSLLPVLSLAANLGIDLSANFSADLAAMIAAVVKVRMPPMPVAAISLMATLSSALTSVATLKQVLGIDPLQAGPEQLQAAVSDKLQETLQQAGAPSAAAAPAILQELKDELARLQPAFNPSAFATPAMVRAVMSVNPQAMAAMSWRVPVAASLQVLAVGQPLLSLTAQLTDSLNLAPSLRPCGGSCDAAALLGALGA